MTIGERLRRLRSQQGWTQDELAERVEMNGRHISRYENGHLEPPKRTVKRLAEALGVPIEALLQDEPHQQLTELLPDPELLEQFKTLVRMDEEDRKAIKRVLAGFIMKQQMQDMLAAAARTA